jgi:hypothetical protein
MNDLRSIRDLYDDPPAPSPDVVHAARRRMTEPVAGRPRSRPGWRFRAGLGVVAAGTAAAVTVPALLAGGPPDTPGPEPRPDAKQMVLAAAHQAERQPLGRYLTTHSRHCFAQPVKAESGTYFVQPCNETWQWRARDRAADSAIWTRDLPTMPQTPADRRLWERAGSPTTFDYHQDPKALPDLYKTTATPWKEDPSDRNEDPATFPLGSKNYTARELQELPTDPESLRAILLPEPKPFPPSVPDSELSEEQRQKVRLREKLRAQSGKRAPGRMQPTGPGQDIVKVESAVAGLPLPPKVWAGIIRMLAQTPGVRAVGRVTDPVGRSGVALEGIRTGSQTGSAMERLIFEPATGRLLASTSTVVTTGKAEPEYGPGRLEGYRLNFSSVWTDRRPTTPPRT